VGYYSRYTSWDETEKAQKWVNCRAILFNYGEDSEEEGSEQLHAWKSMQREPRPTGVRFLGSAKMCRYFVSLISWKLRGQKLENATGFGGMVGEVRRKTGTACDIGNSRPTEKSPNRTSALKGGCRGQGEDYVASLEAVLNGNRFLGWRWCSNVENAALDNQGSLR
jgi:hypothetical protein